MSDDKIDQKKEGTAEPIGEMMDRAERKKLKKKEKDEKSKERDEFAESLGSGRVAEARKAKFKKYAKIGGTLLFIFLAYKAYNYLFNPYMAGPSYGICKVFLENQVRFPENIEYTSLKDSGNSVKIWYTRTDPFGYMRSETISCFYKYDEERGSSIVDRVMIDRREIDPKKVDDFNRVLSVVLQNMPDLTWPFPEGEKNLDAMQIDRNAGRKPIF